VTPPRQAPPTTAPAAFTLHPVTEVAWLRQLGRTMANCLASYGDRLEGRHRIVEVREGGWTRYVVHVRGGRIVTFEAARNQPPDPDDVPVVRALLRREGHLDATRSAPALTAAPTGRQPTPAPRRTAPVTGEPRQPTLLDEPARRRDPRPRAPRPRAPRSRPAAVRPGGLSVQQLATDLLDPNADDPPSWAEVAAALWAAGFLPHLPDPSQGAFERVVRDLARRVATGDDRTLPRGDVRTDAERTAARERLLEALDHVTAASWQRRRMADVLAAPLLP
jgi:hypothetical protein